MGISFFYRGKQRQKDFLFPGSLRKWPEMVQAESKPGTRTLPLTLLQILCPQSWCRVPSPSQPPLPIPRSQSGIQMGSGATWTWSGAHTGSQSTRSDDSATEPSRQAWMVNSNGISNRAVNIFFTDLEASFFTNGEKKKKEEHQILKKEEMQRSTKTF